MSGEKRTEKKCARVSNIILPEKKCQLPPFVSYTVCAEHALPLRFKTLNKCHRIEPGLVYRHTSFSPAQEPHNVRLT